MEIHSFRCIGNFDEFLRTIWNINAYYTCTNYVFFSHLLPSALLCVWLDAPPPNSIFGQFSKCSIRFYPRHQLWISYFRRFSTKFLFGQVIWNAINSDRNFVGCDLVTLCGKRMATFSHCLSNILSVYLCNGWVGNHATLSTRWRNGCVQLCINNETLLLNKIQKNKIKIRFVFEFIFFYNFYWSKFWMPEKMVNSFFYLCSFEHDTNRMLDRTICWQCQSKYCMFDSWTNYYSSQTKRKKVQFIYSDACKIGKRLFLKRLFFCITRIIQ